MTRKDREEASAVFREAVRDVRPMAPVNRVVQERPKPRPHPAMREQDEQAVLAELAHLALDGDDIEMEDDATFLRPGLPPARSRCSSAASASSSPAATRCSPSPSRARTTAAAAR